MKQQFYIPGMDQWTIEQKITVHDLCQSITRNDPELAIDWPLVSNKAPSPSAKDRDGLRLKDVPVFSAHKMKNILITGADGQLGKALSGQVPHGYRAIAANRALLDIVNRNAVFEFFSRHDIAGVINAAAYTSVDKAETEAPQAYAINADGAENLGLAARAHDAPMVQVSTDLVFSGEQGTPYKPQDQHAPQSVYGDSKAKGEDAVSGISGLHSCKANWLLGIPTPCRAAELQRAGQI